VPLIIKWPGVATPGRVVSDPVISTDLYPTCLAAADLPLKPYQHVDGVNLQAALFGTSPLPARSLYWHYPHYNDHPSSVPSSVIRKGQWKLIETFDPAGIELYHLADDIGETTNLASVQSSKVHELRRELDAWRNAVGAERMQPNPDYDPMAAQPLKKAQKKGAKK
jgi:arylsulfatase A